jgi:hypothetical protein
VSSDFPKTWRTYLLLLLFLAGESALFAHQHDITQQDHGADCAICLHAPSSGTAPDTELLLVSLGLLLEQVPPLPQYEVIAENFPTSHLTRAPPCIS